MKTKLYNYQKEGIRFIDRHNGRVLLGDDMGLGKTLQALWARKQFWSNCTTVIVCPKDAKYVWEQEAKKHTKERIVILEGTRVPEGTRLLRKRIYAVNYEIIGAWLPTLLKLKPKMVLIDECHRIMNRRAKCTIATRLLCKKAKRVIAMSGTPFLNRPAELFSTLNILWPKQFPSFWSFGQEYCDPQKKPWSWEFKGATNKKKLRKKLRRLGMIRRRKREVLKDLPDKTWEIIPVSISNFREYREAERDLVKWLIKTRPEKAYQSRKSERLRRMSYLKGLVGRLKLKAVKDWIDNFMKESDDKLLVFGIQRENVVEHLYQHYKKDSVVVHGKIRGRKRQEAYHAFNYKRRIRKLFGNLHAAGVAWSCISSSTVMFPELGWNPALHSQAEDRVHGVGRGRKGRKVMVYYLVGRGTIDEYILKLLRQKQEIADAILDGKKSPESLDLYDALETKLLRRYRARPLANKTSRKLGSNLYPVLSKRAG